MKKLISIRINDRTARQIDELKNSLNETQTGVIALAIEKLYTEEMMNEFEKRYSDGFSVTINRGVIALYDASGNQVTNSNVDYYFDEGAGYGCSTDEEAADKYHELFSNRIIDIEEKMRDYHELGKIADVISNYDTSEATAAEAVEYYEQNEEMPEWYDEHDRGLLIGMVEKLIN